MIMGVRAVFFSAPVSVVEWVKRVGNIVKYDTVAAHWVNGYGSDR
jgi:hypothetical protein